MHCHKARERQDFPIGKIKIKLLGENLKVRTKQLYDHLQECHHDL
jgi:hypothetical protein